MLFIYFACCCHPPCTNRIRGLCVSRQIQEVQSLMGNLEKTDPQSVHRESSVCRALTLPRLCAVTALSDTASISCRPKLLIKPRSGQTLLLWLLAYNSRR